MNFQLVTAISAILLSTLIAVSAMSDPVQDLEECRTISVESERLACFEAGNDQLRAAGMTSDSMLRSRVVEIVKPVLDSERGGNTTGTTRKERRVFGLRLPFFGQGGNETVETFGRKKGAVEHGKDGKIAGISSTATEVSKGAYGKLTITLENGQKWRQTESDRILAKVGDTVAIRAGALSGYFMRVGKGRSVRATRIDSQPAALLDSTMSDAGDVSSTGVKSDPARKEGMFARFGKRISGMGEDTSEENFGQKQSQKDSDASGEVTSMTQTVAEIRVGPFKKFIITLENGQIWKQVEAGRIRISEGDSVTIDQTFMGGFMLKVDDQGRAVRVQRAD